MAGTIDPNTTFLSIPTAARIAGVSRVTLWHYAASGRVPSREIAGRRLIALGDALALKQQLEAAPRRPRRKAAAR